MWNRKTLLWIICLMFILIPSKMFSNNVKITNQSLSTYDPGEGYTMIQFDIGWENSWRLDGVAEPYNWDAVWLFAKFKINDGPFKHVLLSTHDDEHHAPQCAVINVGITEIDTLERGMGVFIYRSENNKTSVDSPGDVYFENVQLRWNYTKQAVKEDDEITIKLFAIEMVYIPKGSFYAGDEVSVGTFRTVEENVPVYISETGTNIRYNHPERHRDMGDETLFEGIYIKGDEGINTNGLNEELNNPFHPTGYRAFYVMKYEITNGQYADFLNILTPKQAESRIQLDRSRISLNDNGKYVTNWPYRPGQFLSWEDGAAYMDWAGVRPITELEYEKMSRGPKDPVPGEFAWGDTTIAEPYYVLENPGEEDEYISDNYSEISGNAHYGYLTYRDSTGYSLGNYPLRVGIFAKGNYSGPANPRVQAGSTYYGVMDISGSLRSRIVSLGSNRGRNFLGNHGTGELTSDGYADRPSWPGYRSETGSITTSHGSGMRGGTYVRGLPPTHLRTSDRVWAEHISSSRQETYGFRGGRSAP